MEGVAEQQNANGYKTLDTLSRRTRRQTPWNDEDRDEEDKQGGGYVHSFPPFLVLVKRVTRDRTVHSRLHPRFDQFRSDPSPPSSPPYRPF